MLGRVHAQFSGRFRTTLASFASLALVLSSSAASAEPKVLDAFEDASAWQVVTSDGVTLMTSSEPGRVGKAIRLDYDFTRGSGYAIIRKRIEQDLPANYRFGFDIKGEGPSNTLEFKLLDRSGDNVWWLNQRNLAFPKDFARQTIPKRRLSFAWGPSGGKPIDHVRDLEIVITSFNGGKGTVWLDELTFEPLPEVRPYSGTPTLTASSTMQRKPLAMEPSGIVDWNAAPGDERPTLTVDFGETRELGGLIINWLTHPINYEIESSLDGVTFSSLKSVRGSNGGRDYLPVRDLTARALRITAPGPAPAPDKGVAIRSLRFMPPEFGEDRNKVLEAIAKDAPLGHYPRYFTGDASYFTVVGPMQGTHEALVSEDGQVELDKQAPSVEPFLYANGKLHTWSDAVTTQSLRKGYLPIPIVTQRWENFELTITVFEFSRGNFCAQYILKNISSQPQEGTFSIALRPMQVNPTYQNLNMNGGAAEVHQVRVNRRFIEADQRYLQLRTAADRAGVTTLAGGEIIEHLAANVMPTATEVTDPEAMASAAASWNVRLGPGETSEFGFQTNFDPLKAREFAPEELRASPIQLGVYLQSSELIWTEALKGCDITLPKGNEHIVDTLKANLAYILINRDGPAIQPGSRCYERTWIRDGSLTSAALLSFGRADAVREFLDWFAPFQYDNGKIPCCVDQRGPDPVPEHDSHGQYIYAVKHYFDATGDADFLRRHWPRVQNAVKYIEFLRAQRMTDEYAKGDEHKRAFYGLVPESISHEGYSAKPMHSYWDTFFIMKGLTDAAEIAEILGDSTEASRLSALRDDFRRTLYASLDLAMKLRGIDYLPGCVELGDFDATSTTVALWPCDQRAFLPERALKRTFEKYWEHFTKRRDNAIEWRDYTPYELRIVGSMVLLGEREKAHEMLDYFFKDQRPNSPAGGFRHWAEVVWKDPRRQGYVGDMPHTWVGSDYINSIRIMLAYEHDDRAGKQLILGAGLPKKWVLDTDGVKVNDLVTNFGRLSYEVRGKENVARYEITKLESVPKGGVLISVPNAEDIQSVDIDGQAAKVENGMIKVLSVPTKVYVRYKPQP